MDTRKMTAAALARAGKLRAARARRKRVRRRAALSLCLCMGVVCGAVLPGLLRGQGAVSAPARAVGALFAGSSAGGYVLVGVVCFMLGTALTLGIMRRNKKQDAEGQQDNKRH